MVRTSPTIHLLVVGHLAMSFAYYFQVFRSLLVAYFYHIKQTSHQKKVFQEKNHEKHILFLIFYVNTISQVWPADPSNLLILDNVPGSGMIIDQIRCTRIRQNVLSCTIALCTTMSSRQTEKNYMTAEVRTNSNKTN